jgi:superfamily II DNA/RNA helicase
LPATLRQFYTVSTRQGDKTTRVHQVISEKSMTKVLVFTQSTNETVHKLALVLEQLGRKGEGEEELVKEGVAVSIYEEKQFKNFIKMDLKEYKSCILYIK